MRFDRNLSKIVNFIIRGGVLITPANWPLALEAKWDPNFSRVSLVRRILVACSYSGQLRRHPQHNWLISLFGYFVDRDISILISYSIVISHSILIEIVLVIVMYVSITIVIYFSIAISIPFAISPSETIPISISTLSYTWNVYSFSILM